MIKLFEQFTKSESLNESLLNGFAALLASETMNFLRESKIKYDKNNERWKIQEFKRSYTYPLNMSFQILVDRSDKTIKSSSYSGKSQEFDNNRSLLTIVIYINPNDEPRCYSSLAGDIKGEIRHELEHKTQEGINRIKDRPRLSEEEYKLYRKALDSHDMVYYFTNKMEMPAYLKQFNIVAKYYKVTIEDVFDDFLNRSIDAGHINESEKEIIMRRWIEEAKKLLPERYLVKEQLNEDIVDTSAVILNFKDSEGEILNYHPVYAVITTDYFPGYPPMIIGGIPRAERTVEQKNTIRLSVYLEETLRFITRGKILTGVVEFLEEKGYAFRKTRWGTGVTEITTILKTKENMDNILEYIKEFVDKKNVRTYTPEDPYGEEIW